MKDSAPTLTCNHEQPIVVKTYAVENHPADSRVGLNSSGVVQTLTSRMGTGGGNTPMILIETYQDVTGPLMANSHPGSYTGQDAFSDMLVAGPATAPSSATAGADCTTANDKPVVVFDKEVYKSGVSASGGHYIAEDGPAPTLRGTGHAPGVAHIDGTVSYIVRRLTPLECERLQGFPDGWTDLEGWTDSKGKPRQTSDSARYKALGNSIALPPWSYVLRKLSLCCGSEATMASLFDGIGGFPLIWESINGPGTCLWASEIEEFPMAVTQSHFTPPLKEE